uniref:ATVPS34 n=1 Tax=Arundo donax TaxID=35708 RepID=A0A0A8ZGL1_ARUDO
MNSLEITNFVFLFSRHLDNLLLTDDGRLFHVDFAFILGRDPKPFPPPMKLCKEMVEAMGGAESQYYTRFKSYCCEAYNILRKSSSLILNLFKLMERSGIPDISSDESGGLKLQEKFRLDLDDEDAIHFFQDLINESVSALFPQMVETIHRWAQYWR